LVVDRRIRLQDLVERFRPSLVGLEERDIFEPAFVELLRSKVEAFWRNLPEVGAVVEMPVVRLGQGATAFHPYTQGEPHHSARDPVNVVFYGNADVDRVASLFRALEPGWIDSDIVKGTAYRIPLAAVQQVSWMDRSPWGEGPGFVESAYSLSPEGCDLQRIHVRLFEGATDGSNEDGWGSWCIGSVHEEDVLNGEFEHTVTDWDGAQKKVERAFQGALGPRCHVAEMRLQEPGEVLRGVAHDGVASAIRLE
jgi:hypothetical protein